MPDTLKHLLIVEDEAPLREAIAEQLTDRGYRVEQAESGEAALAKLADFAFDIIITDLRLPGIDGSAVVEAAVERYPHIIAIVVTGYGTVKDAVEAIKRGAWDYLAKPVDADQVVQALRGNGHADDEAAAPVFAAPPLKRLEWEHIQRVLAECDGNISEAARRLGLHRRTLQRKLSKRPVRESGGPTS